MIVVPTFRSKEKGKYFDAFFRHTEEGGMILILVICQPEINKARQCLHSDKDQCYKSCEWAIDTTNIRAGIIGQNLKQSLDKI